MSTRSSFMTYAALSLLTLGCGNNGFRGSNGEDKKTADSAPAGAVSNTNHPESVVVDSSFNMTIPLNRICEVGVGPLKGTSYVSDSPGIIVQITPIDPKGDKIIYDKDQKKFKDEIIEKDTLTFKVPKAGKYRWYVCDVAASGCAKNDPNAFFPGDVAQGFADFSPGATVPKADILYAGETFNDPKCDHVKVTPLIVNMNKKGIELSSQASGVDFDIDADGEADRISWPITKGNMFVAIDLSGNGKIDSGAELFGNYSPGPDGKLAENGFLALQKYDDNKDLVIDRKDRVFSRLLLWEDKNRDGKSSKDELKTLAQSKVTSINAGYREIGIPDLFGNEFRQSSWLTLEDGTNRDIFDVWFAKFEVKVSLK